MFLCGTPHIARFTVLRTVSLLFSGPLLPCSTQSSANATVDCTSGIERKAQRLYAVHCYGSLYECVVACKVDAELSVGQRVLLLPLGSVLRVDDAKALRVHWHCESVRTQQYERRDATGADDEYCCVVPRCIGGRWSQAAIALVPKARPHCSATLRQLVDAENTLKNSHTINYVAVRRLEHTANLARQLFSINLHSAGMCRDLCGSRLARLSVDLCSNANLLRTLINVSVLIQAIPAEQGKSALIESVTDTLTTDANNVAESAFQVFSIEHRRRKHVYDVRCTETGGFLSGIQLLREAKRQRWTLLPRVSQRSITLRQFLLQSEVRAARRASNRYHDLPRNVGTALHSGGRTARSDAERWSTTNAAGRRLHDNRRRPAPVQQQSQRHASERSISTANSSWRSERLSSVQSATTQHASNKSETAVGNAAYTTAPSGTQIEHVGDSLLVDMDDDALDNAAQRLLRVVDRLLPADAIGILIRPIDTRAQAFIEQQCPYMRFKLGAFVPALSRFSPSPWNVA